MLILQRSLPLADGSCLRRRRGRIGSGRRALVALLVQFRGLHLICNAREEAFQRVDHCAPFDMVSNHRRSFLTVYRWFVDVGTIRMAPKWSVVVNVVRNGLPGVETDSECGRRQGSICIDVKFLSCSHDGLFIYLR